jgi:hypothetical protein
VDHGLNIQKADHHGMGVAEVQALDPRWIQGKMIDCPAGSALRGKELRKHCHGGIVEFPATTGAQHGLARAIRKRRLRIALRTGAV